MMPMTTEERALFAQSLAAWHAAYDPACRMVVRQQTARQGQVHTTVVGDVHPTRDSLIYAVDLLDTGVEEFRRRAIDILEQVLPLQDTNPTSRTRGLWSYYYEEPLDKMKHPDFNWADFCGVHLLQVVFNHGDRLPDELKGRIREALLHATYSIRRRDMRPGYTNIAVMGSYVTLAAAELYGLDDLFIYAKNRLRNLCEYTIYHGGFTEYNSPCYTVRAVFDLSYMGGHVKDPEARAMVEFLLDRLWRDIAVHFHPPTRQWAGPHSRSYGTLANASLMRMIQVATRGSVRLVEDDPASDISLRRTGLRCPEKYFHYFTGLDRPREESLTYFKGGGAIYPKQDNNPPFEIVHEPPRRAASYLCPEFALGSFHSAELYNQARALIAYWGTVERPSYLHLRCLHDGYDYASGILTAEQAQGDLVGIVHFRTNGSDTTLCADWIRDATIKVRDLRLRFEFGGDIEALTLPPGWREGQGIAVSCGNLAVHVTTPYARFGKHEVRFEMGRDERTAWADVVFYNGPEANLCFNGLREALCAFALSIKCGDQQPPDFSRVRFSKRKRLGRMTWREGKRALRVEALYAPASWQEQYKARETS